MNTSRESQHLPAGARHREDIRARAPLPAINRRDRSAMFSGPLPTGPIQNGPAVVRRQKKTADKSTQTYKPRAPSPKDTATATATATDAAATAAVPAELYRDVTLVVGMQRLQLNDGGSGSSAVYTDCLVIQPARGNTIVIDRRAIEDDKSRGSSQPVAPRPATVNDAVAASGTSDGKSHAVDLLAPRPATANGRVIASGTSDGPNVRAKVRRCTTV